MSPFAYLLCSLVATFRVTLAGDVVMTTVRLNAQGQNPNQLTLSSIALDFHGSNSETDFSRQES